jgi:hypothetical protein
MNEHYVWLVWAAGFLVPWLALFVGRARQRRIMLVASAYTMLFGLTEPLFVPRYWNPPSVFDLAQRTGFDIESLIFSFGIGGTGVVFYDFLTNHGLLSLGSRERASHHHRYHRVALVLPVIVFSALFPVHWNPIYPAIAALAAGTIATIACRPDLVSRTLIGGGLFAAFYGLFMLLLELAAPGYIERVWNLPALSGVMIVGIPLEELLFGFFFGMYWSSVLEHFTWQGADARRR